MQFFLSSRWFSNISRIVLSPINDMGSTCHMLHCVHIVGQTMFRKAIAVEMVSSIWIVKYKLIMIKKRHQLVAVFVLGGHSVSLWGSRVLPKPRGLRIKKTAWCEWHNKREKLGVRTKTWTYKSGGSPCIPTRNEW